MSASNILYNTTKLLSLGELVTLYEDAIRQELPLSVLPVDLSSVPIEERDFLIEDQKNQQKLVQTRQELLAACIAIRFFIAHYKGDEAGAIEALCASSDPHVRFFGEAARDGAYYRLAI